MRVAGIGRSSHHGRIAVRDKTRKAEVKGVGESGAVLPSVSTLLTTIGAYEGYTLRYRVLSWEVHGGAPTVLTERFVEHIGVMPKGWSSSLT